MKCSVAWRRAGVATSTLVAALVPAGPAFAAPPGNDHRGSATWVSAADVVRYVDFVDTTEATIEGDDLPCHDSAATVWYLIEGTGNEIAFDTSGSDYDTTVAIADPDGVLLACSDIGPASEPQAAQIVPTAAGSTYFVMVGAARGSSGGQMSLTITDLPPYEEPPPPPPPSPPPVNDALAAAAVLGGLPASVTVDTTGATSDGTEPGTCGAHKSVWFRFTPDADRHVAIDTLGSDYDTQLAVYAESGASLREVACNLDAVGTTQSRVELDLVAGTSYVVLVTSQYRFDTFPPTGGRLVLNAADIEPFTIAVALDDEGLLHRPYGYAVLSGTVTCSRPAFGGVRLLMRQGYGDRATVGHGIVSIDDCTTPARFSTTVFPDSGAFLPGRAMAEAFVEGYSLDVPATSSSTEPVRLRFA